MSPLSLGDEEIQSLGERGWFTRASFLGEAEARAVHAEAKARVEAGQLRPAGIRRGADHTVDRATRGDFITWVTREEQGSGISRLRDAYAALA
jgi:SM-20-related protein